MLAQVWVAEFSWRKSGRFSLSWEDRGVIEWLLGVDLLVSSGVKGLSTCLELALVKLAHRADIFALKLWGVEDRSAWSLSLFRRTVLGQGHRWVNVGVLEVALKHFLVH